MRLDVATPEVLAHSPELAILEVLENASDTACRALFAAHPELNESEFLADTLTVTPTVCLAAAVLSALGTLDSAVNNYRAYVENSLQPRSTAHEIPF